MRRIVRSEQSKRDYLDIWLYIARDNPTAADRTIRRFDEKLKIVAEFPGAGRMRDELEPGLYSISVGNYVLFDQVIEDGIELVRAVHGARDLRRLFNRRQTGKQDQHPGPSGDSPDGT